MDLISTQVILAREAGYIRTMDACRRLDLTPTDLLRRRRTLLESAVGRQLPDLASIDAEAQSLTHNKKE